MDNLAPKIHWLLNENLGSGYHCNNHIFSSRISPNFRIASVLYLTKLYILCFLLLHLLFFNGVLHKSDSSYPCHAASISLAIYSSIVLQYIQAKKPVLYFKVSLCQVLRTQTESRHFPLCQNVTGMVFFPDANIVPPLKALELSEFP